MCMLKLSKVLLYEFHYNYIKNKHSNNSRLLFSDTDSLMYGIETEDFYKGFSNDKEILIFVIIQLNQNIMIIQTN